MTSITIKDDNDEEIDVELLDEDQSKDIEGKYVYIQNFIIDSQGRYKKVICDKDTKVELNDE